MSKKSKTTKTRAGGPGAPGAGRTADELSRARDGAARGMTKPADTVHQTANDTVNSKRGADPKAKTRSEPATGLGKPAKATASTKRPAAKGARMTTAEAGETALKASPAQRGASIDADGEAPVGLAPDQPTEPAPLAQANQQPDGTGSDASSAETPSGSRTASPSQAEETAGANSDRTADLAEGSGPTEPATTAIPLPSTPSLSEATAGFLAHLGRIGKSRGTQTSYAADLDIALGHFGPDAALSDLTRERIAAFADAHDVVRTKSGRPKAQPTIDKTRRVLRQLLGWAVEEGLLIDDPCAGLPLGRRAESAVAETASTASAKS